MAEIHVQARKQPRANPTWMWTWIIIGILIIAAVVYFVSTNKDGGAENTQQEIINERNTPVPGTVAPQKSTETYFLRTVA